MTQTLIVCWGTEGIWSEIEIPGRLYGSGHLSSLKHRMNPALQEVMCDTWGHFYLTEGFKVNNIQLGGSSPQAVITKHPQIRH